MLTTRLAALGTTLILATGLAACGGTSETDKLAGESCDLLKSVDISSFDTAEEIAASGDEGMKNLEKLQEIAEKGEALQKKAEKADISEKEFEAAMRKECGDEMKKFENLGGE